jgi:hypothetical protein
LSLQEEENPMRSKLTVTAFSLALPLAIATQAHAQEAPAPAEAPSSAAGPEQPAAPPAAPEAASAAAATVAPPAPPAAPTPPPVAFGWEALVDAYYLYNFTGDPKTQPPLARQFDTNANSFTLNYAKLGVHADTDLVSFRMDIGGGHTAAVINTASAGYSGPGTTTDPSTALYGNAFLVQQAFATVKPSPYLTIDAGKFVTSASAEVIESNKNWLYSRSLLFYGVPLLHTGLRVNVLPNPELTVSLQVVNGWNNDPDNNSNKTFGGNVTYVPANLGLTASVTTYIGKEGGADGSDARMLFDGVLLKDIGNLSVGLNLDYMKLASANWFGASAMARFIVSDAFNVAARAEYLKNKNLYIASDESSIYEFTGMGAWTVGKHYELRAEVRADMSNHELFDKGGTPRKNQVTGLLAALAYF